ncbi:AI-2E family transporter [Sulfurirhabdus autotrophica]|uniref:Putative PurR-regulated permease PerM n=1 Tax=Sulfurirhabdus autotrophica TaxID=1706046 RepID=A0A4R3YDM7_9PROT|nr:AI-2E family transporter [Sulfurirhabdus autotrophica]TCV90120.1 putative PurR-regulated permease PerM [Sulfurirhabdus autotrophica]
MPSTETFAFRLNVTAWVISGLALIFVLATHLLPALLAGLLVHELVHIVAARIHIKQLQGTKPKLIAIALLATIIVSTIIAAIVGIATFFHSDMGNLSVLLQKMAEILEGSKTTLPAWVVGYIPANAEGLQLIIVTWLREHATEAKTIGKDAIIAGAHILVGLILGMLISLYEVRNGTVLRPLSAALTERSIKFANAFRRVVFAQVRIAAINAFLTWLYLAVALPLVDIHLPLVKTMVALTFLLGLLPVVGNLISNAIIIIVSLSFSLKAATVSLVFLVVIHKLEYFLNAKIVGTQIKAHAWELLLAMLAMESVFGLSGVIAAPIYYAYLKDELSSQKLI